MAPSVNCLPPQAQRPEFRSQHPLKARCGRIQLQPQHWSSVPQISSTDKHQGEREGGHVTKTNKPTNQVKSVKTGRLEIKLWSPHIHAHTWEHNIYEHT